MIRIKYLKNNKEFSAQDAFEAVNILNDIYTVAQNNDDDTCFTYILQDTIIDAENIDDTLRIITKAELEINKDEIMCRDANSESLNFINLLW